MDVEATNPITMDSTDDVLSHLWDESTGLLNRFGAKPTIKRCLGKFAEEMFEWVIAVDQADANHPALTQDAADEGMDMIVTAINTMYRRGVTKQQFMQGLRRVVAKNAAKTQKTHMLDDRTQEIIPRPTQGEVIYVSDCDPT